MPRTLKIVLAYDGTGFVGWQRQARGVSVQGLIEAALARIEGRPVSVIGAGRTDAGVHALGQVASCRLEHSIPPPDLRRALNAMLPAEVRVRDVEEVGDGFHARFGAGSKTYRYAILPGESSSPFLDRFTWHVTQPLDVSRMAAAARVLEGRHDFSAFRSAGSEVGTSTRTLSASTISSMDGAAAFGWLGCCGTGPLLVYEVTGDGFLRHMVRAIVGSLVEVGAGRRDAGWFGQLLGARDRALAGPTAPACGLWLVEVCYPLPAA